MTKRDEILRNLAMVEARYGNTLGASKGIAPVSSKPKVTVRPVGGMKNLTKGPQGLKVKAEWKF